MKKQRLWYAISTVLLLTLIVLIALFVRDRFIRPYFGDVLVVLLIACAVRVFIPTGLRSLPLLVFCFACGVELLQYFHIVERLGLDRYPLVAVAVGGTFSPPDILCYGVGCLLFFAAEKYFIKFKKTLDKS